MRCPECGQKYRAEIAHDTMTTHYDRMKEALKRIDAVTFTDGPEYGLMLARIARDALKEIGQ